MDTFGHPPVLRTHIELRGGFSSGKLWAIPLLRTTRFFSPMPDEYLQSLRLLIEVIDEFLESGIQSGEGENDEPPDRDMVLPDGDFHNAVVNVQRHFQNRKLPAPDARNPWVKLCRARDREGDDLQWQTKAHKYAQKLKEWAEFSLANAALDDLVTLDQVAPLTGLSKRTLERYLKEEKLPQPDYHGGGGKAHKWLWKNVRPHLELISKRHLPQKFPGSRLV